MKNILVIAVVSLVLFSISAALSLWLQTSKQTVASDSDKKDEAKKSHSDHEGAASDKHDEHTSGGSSEKPFTLKPLDAGPKDREEKYELQQAKMEVILYDMRLHREEFEKKAKLLSDELRTVQAEVDASDARLKQAQQIEEQKKKESALKPTSANDPPNPASLAKVASLAEQMEPAELAKMITEMAGTGNRDRAARILHGMKETKAAKVLAEIEDVDLQNALVDRILTLGADTNKAAK